MKIIHILKSSKLYLLLPIFVLAVPVLGAQLSGLKLMTPIIQNSNQNEFKSIIVKYLSPSNTSDYYGDDVYLFIGGKRIAQLSFNTQVIIPVSKSSDITKMNLMAKYKTQSAKCILEREDGNFVTCNINPIKIEEQEIQLFL